MRLTFSALAAVLFFTLSAPVAAEQAKGATTAHVTSADAIKFMPLDPKNPGGIQVSVLSGDLMAKAPVTFFMKLPKGASGLHTHTAGYHAVVIRGQAKHWAAGGEATAQVVGPGSTWYQPGNAVHGDECVSAECLLLLTVEGPFDFMPAK
jgi:quercetin dioxygenase-like cupin family protein